MWSRADRHQSRCRRKRHQNDFCTTAWIMGRWCIKFQSWIGTLWSYEAGVVSHILNICKYVQEEHQVRTGVISRKKESPQTLSKRKAGKAISPGNTWSACGKPMNRERCVWRKESHCSTPAALDSNSKHAFTSDLMCRVIESLWTLVFSSVLKKKLCLLLSNVWKC